MYILQNIFNKYILIFKKNGVSYRHNEGFKNCLQLFSHLNNNCQFAVSVAQETSIVDVSWSNNGHHVIDYHEFAVDVNQFTNLKDITKFVHLCSNQHKLGHLVDIYKLLAQRNLFYKEFPDTYHTM